MKTTKYLIRKLSLLVVLVAGFSLNCQAQVQEDKKPERIVQSDEPQDDAEELPRFGNAPDDLKKFLVKNIKYPNSSQKKGEQGLVLVQFIVERDGSLSNIQVVRSVSRALDKEALRVVGKMSKKWTPGRKDGKPMRVRYTLPIQFRLK